MIAFKRTNIAAAELESGMSKSEQDELDEMMEDNDDEYVDEGDEEEALYEQLIMKTIEMNKLNEVKRNFLLDKGERNEEGTVSDTEATDEKASKEGETKSGYIPEEDLYTPARMTWGVYKRPRDISKAFGGGRAITREEMDRMDAEAEEREKKTEKVKNDWMTATMKLENENKDKIKDSLERSRNFMYAGNRKAAVERLESVKPFLSFQTDVGGEVLLELGMAYETVDRIDDARQIYSTLASASWSQKVRRNSLSLLQGLDISKQIRKDIDGKITGKPLMDVTNMYQISRALEAGLTNEWDNYKKKDFGKDNNIKPWFDDGNFLSTPDQIVTFRDAYFVLERCLNPLKKVPSEMIVKAFNKIYLSSDTEKLTFLKSRGLVTIKDTEQNKLVNENLRNVSFLNQMNAKRTDMLDSSTGAKFAWMKEDYEESSVIKKPVTANDKKVITLNSNEVRPSIVYGRLLNGTWDLVTSIKDKAPYLAERFESGTLRRTYDKYYDRCSESNSVMWGMSTKIRTMDMSWSDSRSELTLSGGDVQTSIAPWQKTNMKDKDKRIFDIIFCDDSIIVTRELTTSVSDPALYTLWKKVLPTIWKKY